jgi:hypothetical protein
MFARHGALASSALVLAFAPVVPRATVMTKYRVDVKTETTIDLSVVGQPVQVQSANLSAWIAITLSDSAGGRVVHSIIDSVTYSGTAPIEAASVDSARGAMVHGFIGPDGKVKNLTSRPPSLLVGQVQGMVNGFFPRMKLSAKAGDTWMDTTRVTNSGGGNNTVIDFFINYTAGAQEAVAGIPAMKVTGSSRSTISGTIDSPMAGQMEVSGAGSGTSNLLVGVSDGRILGVNATSTNDQKLKLGMMPTEIPVKTVQSVVITLRP